MDGWMDGRAGGRAGGRTDGRMDGCCVSQGGRGCGGGRSATGWVVLVAWFVGCLVGLLAWPRCCLVGWSAGWHSVDGCMDGRMLCKWGGRSASPAMQTKPPPHGISSTYSTWGKHGVMWFGCLACWLLGGFVGLAALLLGWLVGWHSVDGCMDGRMDGSCMILCCLTFRRRPGQFPAVPVVPDSLCAVSGRL